MSECQNKLEIQQQKQRLQLHVVKTLVHTSTLCGVCLKF